ncbi:archaeal proteasome endopeptidase complex subunit beta [Candidatus Hecatella orcuttiae]|jgi:proteasome beta subunit|uniref:archaeal proteasome endopeptidase complex subunit beta n=1 Tax=Candidatus Hecatella orcuttiae TaxID=1935119 RepID=UPI0028681505|nr:archaeal proteasome endopeptidase complex subunit beta [Candidatus Hecatella orcuttiae]
MQGLYGAGIHKGTTTVGVVCKDGVALATDTRVTTGYFIAHKKGKKIHKIDDHLAMTIAGAVADAQNVVDILKANAALFKLTHKRPMPVASATRLAANLLFYNRYIPLLLQAIVAGVDTEGAHIFSLDPFGSVTEEEKFFSTGSGSPVALGILEDGFKENLTTEEAVPLVVRAVKAAMKRDAASGDSFDVAIIDKAGYRELTEEEKAKYVAT